MVGNGSKYKGWIKAPRYWLEDPIIMKNSRSFAVWNYLNLNAAHQEREVEFGGKRYKLKPGELITGRKSIGDKLKIPEITIQRILKSFENDGLIEQKTSNKNRVILIKSWRMDQNCEHQDEQQKSIQNSVFDNQFVNLRMANEQQSSKYDNTFRTTIEQQPDTNKNYNNLKNGGEVGVKQFPYYEQVIECFKSWNKKPAGDEITIVGELILKYRYQLVREGFKKATLNGVKKLSYVKKVIESEYKIQLREKENKERLEARRNKVGPSFEVVNSFFIKIGSTTEKAKEFFDLYAPNDWELFGEGYIGYCEDWKKKAASSIGKLYRPIKV